MQLMADRHDLDCLYSMREDCFPLRDLLEFQRASAIVVLFENIDNEHNENLHIGAKRDSPCCSGSMFGPSTQENIFLHPPDGLVLARAYILIRIGLQIRPISCPLLVGV